ncbi:MAG: 30S ribosomal protein S6 [SAR324 cluster bacterium]|nr:30S ribosomal protein S6 [SAR324 cluster bacterium]
MEGYESVIITDPDLTEEDTSGILDKVKDTITSHGGEVQKYHLWGRRRLAYLINKKNYGVYHIFYFTGDGELLNDLNQYYRYSENILRFQTIKVENIQEEFDRFLEYLKAAAAPQNPKRHNERANTPAQKVGDQTVETEIAAEGAADAPEEKEPETELEAVTSEEDTTMNSEEEK